MMIKKISSNEYATVIDLFDQYRMFYLQPSDPDLCEKFIRQRLDHNESVIFVAFADEEPVGFTQLYPAYSSVRLIKGWILNDLYVIDSFRRKGIADALIASVIEMAHKDGSKFVQLETSKDNINAQALYDKTGFVRQPAENEFYTYLKTI